MGSSIPCLSSCVIRPDSAEARNIAADALCGRVLIARFTRPESGAARRLDHASRFIGLSLILSYGQLTRSKAAKERWVGWRASVLFSHRFTAVWVRTGIVAVLFGVVLLPLAFGR